MKKIILLLTVILSLSCKDKAHKELKVEQPKETELSINKEYKLQVVINALVLVDDVFEVYFYEIEESKFHSKDYVFAKVKGDSISQDIILTLPDKIYPERLRLDFGKTPKQKEIQLNSIKLKYGDKEYLFTKDEIFNEFKPSKFIDFDKVKMTIRTKEIDGRYDPYFYSKKVGNIVDYLLED